MDFDFLSFFSNALVAGVPLIFVVQIIVQIFKETGVTGKALFYCALASGFVLGMAYQLAASIPVDFAGWLSYLVFSLLLGYGATKLYDALTDSGPSSKRFLAVLDTTKESDTTKK